MLAKCMTFVWVLVLLSGCTMFQRSWQSGYAEGSLEEFNLSEKFYQDKREHERNQALNELGYHKAYSLGQTERSKLGLRLYLKRLEAKLQTDGEKRHYYSHKPLLANDSERIRFLSIPSIEGRDRWFKSQGFSARRSEFSPETIALIENKDIAVGMNSQAVRESWGEPDSIDVAGNEIYGNHAWRYDRMVSSVDGYKKESRIIYFEAGRVAGWESY